jgi:hypothetical protein
MPDRNYAIEALAELIDEPFEWAELFKMQPLLIEAIEAFPDGATVQQIRFYIRDTWRVDVSMRSLTTNLSVMRKEGKLCRRRRMWTLAK